MIKTRSFKIEQLKIEGFENFYVFAKDFIFNQFLDYSPQLRVYWWRVDFEKDSLRKKLAGGENTVLLGKVGKEIVGFSLINYGPGGGVHLSWMGVDERYRGQGIGSAFLRETEKLALRHYSHFIYLWTENDRNIEFYKKRGFYYVGVQREAWCGMDEHLMQKNIAKPFKKILEKKIGGI